MENKKVNSRPSVSFKRLENLAYHAAYKLCHDERLSEEAVIFADKKVKKQYKYFESLAFNDQKILLALISCFFVANKIGEENKEVFDSDPKKENEDYVVLNEELVDGYSNAIDHLPDMDQILFLMAIHFRLSDAQIAQLVSWRTNQVSQNIEASSELISEKVQDDQIEPIERKRAMQRACSIYIKSWMDRIEALSNLSEHEFGLASSEQAEKDAESSEPFVDDEFPEDFREEEEDNTYSSQWPYYLIWILAIVLIVVILRMMVFKPKDNEVTIPSNSNSIPSTSDDASSDTTTEEKPDAPNATETHPIPRRYYGAYENFIIFVDPKTNICYEYTDEGGVKKIADIDQETQDHSGIHHIGRIDEIIYIAFIDGKGATISGDSAKLEMEPYWQNAWFNGQLVDQPETDKPVEYNGIVFTFESEEEED